MDLQEYMNLQDFCLRTGAIVSRHPDREVPERIAELLPALLRRPDLLTAAQCAAPETGYGRHDVFICPREKFSVIAAVWPPGISSPVHDHFTWCSFGVYRGVLLETRYDPIALDAEEARAVMTGVHERVAGDVSHLSRDESNIHCIHNPGDIPAISIHVYAGNSLKMGPNVEKVYTVEA